MSITQLRFKLTTTNDTLPVDNPRETIFLIKGMLLGLVFLTDVKSHARKKRFGWINQIFFPYDCTNSGFKSPSIAVYRYRTIAKITNLRLTYVPLISYRLCNVRYISYISHLSLHFQLSYQSAHLAIRLLFTHVCMRLYACCLLACLLLCSRASFDTCFFIPFFWALSNSQIGAAFCNTHMYYVFSTV